MTWFSCFSLRFPSNLLFFSDGHGILMLVSHTTTPLDVIADRSWIVSMCSDTMLSFSMGGPGTLLFSDMMDSDMIVRWAWQTYVGLNSLAIITAGFWLAFRCLHMMLSLIIWTWQLMLVSDTTTSLDVITRGSSPWTQNHWPWYVLHTGFVQNTKSYIETHFVSLQNLAVDIKWFSAHMTWRLTWAVWRLYFTIGRL